jgi:hypothetical protein
MEVDRVEPGTWGYWMEGEQGGGWNMRLLDGGGAGWRLEHGDIAKHLQKSTKVSPNVRVRHTIVDKTSSWTLKLKTPRCLKFKRLQKHNREFQVLTRNKVMRVLQSKSSCKNRPNRLPRGCLTWHLDLLISWPRPCDLISYACNLRPYACDLMTYLATPTPWPMPVTFLHIYYYINPTIIFHIGHLTDILV